MGGGRDMMTSELARAENLFMVHFPYPVSGELLIDTFCEAAATILTDGRTAVNVSEEKDASGAVYARTAEAVFDSIRSAREPEILRIFIGGEKLRLDLEYNTLPLYLSRARRGLGLWRAVNLRQEHGFQTLMQQFVRRWKILLPKSEQEQSEPEETTEDLLEI